VSSTTFLPFNYVCPARHSSPSIMCVQHDIPPLQLCVSSTTFLPTPQRFLFCNTRVNRYPILWYTRCHPLLKRRQNLNSSLYRMLSVKSPKMSITWPIQASCVWQSVCIVPIRRRDAIIRLGLYSVVLTVWAHILLFVLTEIW
jgi:hypothetical protein